MWGQHSMTCGKNMFAPPTMDLCKLRLKSTSFKVTS